MVKIKPGLLKANAKFIQRNQWYHQRFDGCLHLMLVISYAEKKKEARKFPWGHFLIHWGYFKDDKCDWYIDMRDINRVTGKFIELTKRDSRLSKKIIKKWDRDEKRFYEYCHQLDKMNLKKLSGPELKKAYSEMLNRSTNSVTSSSVIDGFALGSDNYIFENLYKFLEAKGLERQRQRYFAILTAPVHQSFMAATEIKLLKIGQQIIKTPTLYRFVKKSTLKDIEKKIKDYSKIYQALQKYQQDHFWTRNNYVDNNILTVHFFLKELAAMLKGKVNINEEIKRLANTPKNNKLSKQKLVKELKLPAHLRNLLIVSEDFTYWQDERKKKTYWYTHYLSLILEEVGRRFGFTLHQVKYFSLPELLDLFNGAEDYKVTKQEANKRLKSCLWYQQGDLFDQLSGPAASKLRKDLLKRDSQITVDDFRGMAASKGVARGPARIIKSVKDGYKVKKGDVLVAVMTRPDYVPAMKKAVAVVTNEGGVTCHAAIVSRELGIPCVIGTKIATAFLKDGMMVEVNANHGVVKIIKSDG